MSKPVDFKGANAVFNAAPGDERDVGPAIARVDPQTGAVIVCWELSLEELKHIGGTGRVYVSMLSAGKLMPHYVGSGPEVSRVLKTLGGEWEYE